MNPSRRHFLSAASLAAGGLALGTGRSAAAPAKIDTPFKHSVMGWCFNGRGVEPKQLAEWCVKLGMH
ncbi:MAG: twin-arginine translocation signal domain-containing protein, partial [Akkermansiaceae bacterium]